MPYTDYIRQTPEGYIRVVNSADYDSIVSYTPLPDITVFVDAVVNLPNTVQATFKSGKVETMVIKWERVNVDTSTAGTQKIYGDIGNGAAAVLQNVIVEENLTDLDILRQIRNANPTSQLPNLWLDSEDPYTQWEGVIWDNTKVQQLILDNINVTNIELTNRLISLTQLFVRNCDIGNITIDKLINLTGIYLNNTNTSIIDTSLNVNLDTFTCINNLLSDLDLSENKNLHWITCSNNLLTNIILPYFTDEDNPEIKNNAIEYLYVNNNQLTKIDTLYNYIQQYNYIYNNFPTAELDRFRALGFTDESKLLPQNP